MQERRHVRQKGARRIQKRRSFQRYPPFNLEKIKPKKVMNEYEDAGRLARAREVRAGPALRDGTSQSCRQIDRWPCRSVGHDDARLTVTITLHIDIGSIPCGMEIVRRSPHNAAFVAHVCGSLQPESMTHLLNVARKTYGMGRQACASSK